MEKKVYLLTLLLIALFMLACDNDVVDPSKEKGIVFINSTPDAAEVWIDGTNTLKLTPAKVELIVGKHVVTVRKKQYVSQSITIDVKSNQDNIVNIKNLVMLGGIIISSQPSYADIFIDNFDQQTVTPNEFNLREGIHQITLKLDDFFDSTFAVDIKNSEDVTAKIKLRSKSIVWFEGIIWDSTSTDPNRLGGLDLSTGTNVVFKNKKGKSADLYYSSKNNIIGNPNKVYFDNKNTMIKEGDSPDYTDRTNAPEEQDDSWSDSTFADVTNYLFLYDSGGHNSKLKIVENVTSGSLKGIKVKWIYNKKPYDNFF